MSSAGTIERREDETAASAEIPLKDTAKGALNRQGPLEQNGEKPHPLSRQAQEGSLNWFTIFFMGLFHAGAVLAFFFFTWSALAVAETLWFVTLCLGIGVGYHRLLTHRGYKVPKPLEYMLAVLRDEKADPERRDRMAAAAAPYIHPRLANVEASIAVTGHEAALAELEEIEAVKPLPALPVN